MVLSLRGVDTVTKIVRTAEFHGVDPALAVAVAQVESGINQNARGSSGEIGIFQLMPSTARYLGVDPYDEDQNIEGGVRYLKEMLRVCGGDAFSALLAYNSGPDACTRGNAPPRSYDYASKVISTRNRWSVAFSEAAEREVLARIGEGQSGQEATPAGSAFLPLVALAAGVLVLVAVV